MPRAVADLEATAVVEDLLGVEPRRRNAEWLRALHAVVADAALAGCEPQLTQGPDGFGYFALQLPPPGPLEEPYTVRHVLEPCTVGGFGCVILDHEGEAAWVFSYGELWSLRAKGHFDTPSPGDDSGPVTVEDDEEVVISVPDEVVLPDWARRVLRIAIGHLDVAVPRVALVVRPGRVPERTLVLGPLGHVAPDDRHHLTWYLPRHLGLIYDEDDRWADSSVPL